MANPYRLLPASHHHPLLLLPSSAIRAIPLCPQNGQTGHSCCLGSAGSGLPWKESSTEGHQASLETPPQTACRPLSQMRLKHLLTQLCAQSVHTVGLQLAHRIKADLWFLWFFTESSVKLIPYKDFAAPLRISYCGLPLFYILLF